jgi:hypothetical protein
VSAIDVEERAEPAAVAEVARRPRRRLAELAVYGGYLLLAVFVTIRLWIDPNGRALTSNYDDHNITLFMFAHGERVLFAGDNPFFSHQLNFPDGVNMMAQTAMLALTLPLAPVSHFFGVGAAVCLMLTLGLAGTASAWYFVLSRHLVRSRVAAAIGAAWCGFCPAMIAHANGHVNWVSAFVVPFIVWQVLRLREEGRVLSGGITLGLLIVLQTFINEESLLFLALTLAAFAIAYTAMAFTTVREYWKRFVAGLGVAAATAGVVLAYPLWFQFTGPGSYHGQPFAPEKYVTDLLSLPAFARQSLAGSEVVAKHLSVSATEDNTFFGLPLVILLMVAIVLLWRSVAARSAVIAGFVLLVMSLGPRLRLAGHDTAIPLPFALISHVPVIDLVSVTRFALVAAIVVGVVLALAADRVRQLPRPKIRAAFWAGLAVALIPVFPKPLPIVVADPLPPFIAGGMWRNYVTPGHTLVSVPLPEVTTGRTGMRWATLSHLAYPTPRGYFMGPRQPPEDLTGSWNAPRRTMQTVFSRVSQRGKGITVTDETRAVFRADLQFWGASVVVLVPHAPGETALRATLIALFQSQPERVGGVELWRVPSGG